jgi:hypothetical protein
VYGRVTSTSGGYHSAGVYGYNSSTNPSAVGVFGNAAQATGVAGISNGGTGVFGQSVGGTGVYAEHVGSGTTPAIYGSTATTSRYGTAIYGIVSSTTAPQSAAIYGRNNFTQPNGNVAAIVGDAPNGTAVKAISSTGTGIEASTVSGFFAGTFQGNVFIDGDLDVVGTCICGSAGLRIDNPIDPAHGYLQHAVVASPDMKDVYDGIVTTGARGFGIVALPAYFQALNRSFRYQLTVVGRSFARAIVWREIAHNRFTIRTDRPHVKVSWQVTGIRHDAYANANRVRPLEPKPTADQGKYLHPELYGKPKSAAVGYRPPLQEGRK